MINGVIFQWTTVRERDTKPSKAECIQYGWYAVLFALAIFFFGPSLLLSLSILAVTTAMWILLLLLSCAECY